MHISLFIILYGCALAFTWLVLESGHDRDENAPTYGGFPR